MHPKIKKQIDSEVGAPFSLRERWKLGGIGSSKLNITHASIDIHNLLVLDNNNCSCNIELRPKGIIIHLNKRATRYSWIVPYYQLSLFYSNDFSFHSNGQFLRIQKDALSKKSRPFINKIIQQKAQVLKS